VLYLNRPVKKRIGLGTWSWGNKLFWNYKSLNDDDLRETYNEALRRGFDLIDTADSYGTGNLQGRSELLIGKFLLNTPSAKKQRIQVATKLAPYPWRIGDRGFNKPFLKSLERLNNKLDIVQLHWSTAKYNPWQELGLLNNLCDLKDQGFDFQIGLSNIGPQRLKKLINFGPSGRAVAQPIDKSLLDNIFEHLTMERYANVQYFSIYLWFQERDLNGFASHFLSESQGEIEHAQKFADYLIARGQSVKLDEIPAPTQTWDSIEELISYSFSMEADLTSSLQQLYSISERISDTRTNVFLDPIIEAQTQSEDEFANILGKVKFASNQPSAILLIDSDLKKK